MKNVGRVRRIISACSSRYARPEEILGSRPFGNDARPHDEAWYLAQLEAAAQSAIRLSGSNKTVRRRIVGSITMSGGNLTLDNAIVLRGIRVSGGNVRGNGYLLRGYPTNVSGGDDNANTYELSPELLYKKAVELGMITE